LIILALVLLFPAGIAGFFKKLFDRGEEGEAESPRAKEHSASVQNGISKEAA
jgi:branched-chain amino acid transport system permease protein